MPQKLFVLVAGILFACSPNSLRAAEVIELNAHNWDRYAPAGKEADAIYGDHVLASDKIIAVVAQAVDTRHANMTVRNVGGSIIDLTLRDHPNDQLSAFYPHTGDAKLEGPVDWAGAFGEDATADGETASQEPARLAFRLIPATASPSETAAPLQFAVGYELADGADYVTVVTKVTNPNASPIPAPLTDSLRADGEFQFGFDNERELWWAHDRFWGQAYGVQPAGEILASGVQPEQRRNPRAIEYKAADGSQITVPAGGSVVLRRRLFPASDSLAVQAIACRERGVELSPVQINVRDPQGRVADAQVELYSPGGELYGAARTNDNGHVIASVPAGTYRLLVTSHGRRAEHQMEVTAGLEKFLEISLRASGYVEARITDDAGGAIACRVAFLGEGDTPDPDFGPNSAVYGVKNLQHTPDGRFRVPLVPGRYQVVITHGPEYNAILKTIEVIAGETTALNEKLARSVNTTGWLSADFHSHSTPSGDNTASQRGRVLNLLAEHIEFAPCTEHNRIDSYVPHLKFFKAEDRMATCCGMELTGQPLPLNHQNAFPLIEHPRTQDGGGPTTHVDPVVQIERLAMWDDAADKLVQINHPNIVQMIGDRDLNGTPDGGFERMFHFMDVIEVHPPTDIFRTPTELTSDEDRFGVRMFNWLQLLNLGYRVPGVVNTDAHWNYYGSGGLRNYIRSTTDNPADARIEDLVRESELGHIVITNGPFLEVKARAVDNAAANGDGPLALPGDDLSASGGKLALRVRVECPNWIQVNRVQLFINGRPVDEHNYTKRNSASMFRSGPIVFDEELTVTLTTDAHIVVAVAGEGTQLGLPYGPLDSDEPYVGNAGATMPVAVANPIFVDVDGNGFEPNGDTLDLPLPVSPEHRPSHGHDHANFESNDGVSGVEPKASRE
jgi:hypothetical protein